MNKFGKVVSIAFLGLVLASVILAQKATKPAIFAVLEKGTNVEPIAYIVNGKLEPAVNGSDDRNIIAAFNKAYYKPGTIYHMIFGGSDAGTVTVKGSNSKSE